MMEFWKNSKRTRTHHGAPLCGIEILQWTKITLYCRTESAEGIKVPGAPNPAKLDEILHAEIIYVKRVDNSATVSNRLKNNQLLFKKLSTFFLKKSISLVNINWHSYISITRLIKL